MRKLSRPASTIVFVGAAIGIAQFAPASTRHAVPLGHYTAHALHAEPALDAFGVSGDLKVRFALPAEAIEFPLALTGDPQTLSYEWVAAEDSSLAESPRSLADGPIQAPSHPGFYRMALVRGGTRTIIPEPVLAVKVPFADKEGGWLNGYRIGTYLGERLHAHRDHPDGFVQVEPQDAALPVSEHFRVADFITHDAQSDVWPKYVALNPRLLDKLELVIAKIREAHGGAQLALDVHSGFRTPAHNASVRRAASDSRHQYGDAADVVIDANGDGRIDLTDEVIVAAAVEQVEEEHPDLVGGMGLYTSRRYATPYVHIDARGKRTRWRG